MAKRKQISGDNQNTNDNLGKGCLTLVGIFLFIAFIIYTCSDNDEEELVNGISNSEEFAYRSSLKSKAIVNEVNSKLFNTSDEGKEIPEMTLGEISEIHQYLCIERWNSGGQIGMRWGTKYEEAAENLDIPVSKLKAADDYYHYRLLPELTKVIKKIYDGHPNVVIDYYNPLSPTAYCGLNTIIGGITVYGQKKNTDFKEEAKKVAIEFANQLPEWVTGFKLHYTMYKDTILQTEDEVDIGFLWRQGEDIQIMRATRGLYGYSRPTENRNWHNDEWNNLKAIQHPNYSYLKK